MTQLSENFTLEEATYSETAIRLNIDNQPDATQLANMTFTASQMELIRAAVDSPIKINSWLRQPAVNEAVGGVGHSAHMDGFATDSNCSKFANPLEYAKFVQDFLGTNGTPFDQIIHEYGSWMHISFAPAARGMTLTIFHNDQGKKYLTGLLSQDEYLAA